MPKTATGLGFFNHYSNLGYFKLDPNYKDEDCKQDFHGISGSPSAVSCELLKHMAYFHWLINKMERQLSYSIMTVRSI